MHVYVPGVLFVDALSCQLFNAYPQGDVSQIYSSFVLHVVLWHPEVQTGAGLARWPQADGAGRGYGANK